MSFNVHDSTTNNDDGTKVAANKPILTTSGKIGEAQDFVPADSPHILLTTAALTAPDYTVEFWAAPDNIAATGCLFAFGYTSTGNSGCALGLYIGADPWILVGNIDNVKGLKPISTYLANGVWHHWCNVVHAYNDIIFYLDGSAQTLVSALAFTNNFTNIPIIGSRNNGSYTLFFDGKIDEVRISDSLRSAAWVKATYNSGADLLLDWGSEEAILPTGKIFLVDRDNHVFRINPTTMAEEKVLSIA